jgi:hypothetical protein
MSSDYNRKIIQITGVGRDLYALANTGDIWQLKYCNNTMKLQWVKVKGLPAEEDTPAWMDKGHNSVERSRV